MSQNLLDTSAQVEFASTPSLFSVVTVESPRLEFDIAIENFVNASSSVMGRNYERWAKPFKPKRGGKSQVVKFKAQKIARRKNRSKP
jgi:hypothetical protein